MTQDVVNFQKFVGAAASRFFDVSVSPVTSVSNAGLATISLMTLMDPTRIQLTWRRSRLGQKHPSLCPSLMMLSLPQPVHMRASLFTLESLHWLWNSFAQPAVLQHVASKQPVSSVINKSSAVDVQKPVNALKCQVEKYAHLLAEWCAISLSVNVSEFEFSMTQPDPSSQV